MQGVPTRRGVAHPELEPPFVQVRERNGHLGLVVRSVGEAERVADRVLCSRRGGVEYRQNRQEGKRTHESALLSELRGLHCPQQANPPAWPIYLPRLREVNSRHGLVVPGDGSLIPD